MKDLLTHNFSIFSYDAFCHLSQCVTVACSMAHSYILTCIDAFQTHFLADLNVHNNVPGSNFQFVSMFPVCFVICSQYGFGNPLQLLGPINFIQESAAKNLNQDGNPTKG